MNENNEIKTANDKQLCSMIIAYRVLGYNKALSIECMKELAERRANGNVFNFEEYIETEIKKIPKQESQQFGKTSLNGIFGVKSIMDFLQKK